MRANTNISLKARRRLSLTDFRGVDLSASPLRVSTSRATECKNLYCRDGLVRKRPGWQSLLQLEGRVNGIFPLASGMGDMLVHAGTVLYLVESLNGKLSYTKKHEGLFDQRSQCFFRDGRAFLIGAGAPLVYEMASGSVAPLTAIAYVPTTTVSIDPYDAGEDPVRATLDEINLLTPKRKNELVVTFTGDLASFWLDGIIDTGSDVSVTLYNEYHGTQITADAQAYGEGIFENGVRFRTSNGEGSTRTTLTLSLENATEEQKGLVKAYFKKAIVTFSSTMAGHLARITYCRFGAVFGTNGEANRLFLSGNDFYRNMDFWSEFDDFTYFPEGNAMEVGSADSSIKGYLRLSDSTLAVFKEAAPGEATIYYRTGVDRSEVDADGDTVLRAEFPVVAGTAGEELATPFGVANLGGDTLMVSSRGVFGIERSSNLASVERVTRERSRALGDALRNHAPENYACAVFDGRFYLAVGDNAGTCYVADSRYRATFEGSTDTGYEWWVWQHVPARTFAVLDGALCFGTADGAICRFDEAFADRLVTELAKGDLTVNDAGLSYNEGLGVSVGDRLELDGELFALFMDNCQVDSEGLLMLPDDEALLSRIYEGMELYADGNTSPLGVYAPYYVTGLDLGALRFGLVDENKNKAPLFPLQALMGFRLSEKITAATLQVLEVGDTLTLGTLQGEPFSLVNYHDTNAAGFTGRLIKYTPVEAHWCSPVLDLGTDMERKNLLELSVSMAPDSDAVTVGIETRRGEWALVAGRAPSLDFNALDFNNFSFLAPFTTSFTKRLAIRGVNYVRFCYASNTDTDCAVNGITVTYTINQRNRGMH